MKTLRFLPLLALSAFAAEPAAQPINLAAVMRIAGADNIDIQLAQQRFVEAEANHRQALAQFFPYLAPGLAYKRHEGNIQNVEGDILDIDKQSLALGVSVAAQLDLGDSIYKSMVAARLVAAAEFGAESQRQESVFQAVSAFLDLTRASAATKVALESVNIADDYASQVKQAVGAGLGFKGDQFRSKAQAEKNRLLLRQAQEQRRVAAARLATALRMSPTIDLRPERAEPAPVRLIERGQSLASLVNGAVANRPELRQSGAEREAAAKARAGTIYGPLVPSVRAEYFYGGLGGGRRDDGPSHTNDSHDLGVGLSWRIGPGGIGDFPRIDASTARLRIAELSAERLELEVKRQVVEAHARVQSYGDQLTSAREALAASEEALKLARQRQQFGVGEVLENIQAEQDLTRSRLDYLTVVTEYNRAQFALRRAIGGRLGGEGK
ncbi:MAG: TolC family protein [Chthoniobacteraceae bacterium]